MPYAATRSIEGTVAVITGASAGIGAATARTLVDAGARVVLGARRKDRLSALVDELGADHAVAVPGDVREPEYNDALVAAAVDRWGRCDTVVANAGIGAYGGILDLDDALVREMVETNYLATVWTVRSARVTAATSRSSARSPGSVAAPTRRSTRARSSPRSDWAARWIASCGSRACG
jgi:NADP-dependent 3-hydroxy acid dehydrogenase YdfG